jgi:hypothetical protein
MEGEGHRRNANQPLEAEQEEEDAAVAAMLCISRPNPRRFLDSNARRDCAY